MRQNETLSGQFHELMTQFSVIRQKVLLARGNEGLGDQFSVIQDSLERCRELCQAAAIVNAQDASCKLRTAAPALKTIGLNTSLGDAQTIALLRNQPNAVGEDFVCVTVAELKALQQAQQDPEQAVPSYFVRQAFKAATTDTTSTEALKDAMGRFMDYCGATDRVRLVDALIGASVAYAAASEVGHVVSPQVTRSHAVASLAALVRAVKKDAALLYGSYATFAITDLNGSVTALPPLSANKEGVKSFCKRHGLEFSSVWALHRATKDKDGLCEAILAVA